MRPRTAQSVRFKLLSVGGREWPSSVGYAVLCGVRRILSVTRSLQGFPGPRFWDPAGSKFKPESMGRTLRPGKILDETTALMINYITYQQDADGS